MRRRTILVIAITAGLLLLSWTGPSPPTGDPASALGEAIVTFLVIYALIAYLPAKVRTWRSQDEPTEPA